MAKENNGKCMTTDCDREVYSRGICRQCYVSARDLISGGKSTWDDMEKLGLVLPSRLNRSKFLNSFESKKKGKK
jgi:hypothetical protein